MSAMPLAITIADTEPKTLAAAFMAHAHSTAFFRWGSADGLSYLRQAKIQDLGMSPLGYKNVGRFDVAVHSSAIFFFISAGVGSAMCVAIVHV